MRMTIKELRMSLSKLIGYRGWKVWMSSDMQISLLAIFYVLLVDNLFRPLESLILISSLGFYVMYGFLINDFFDMPYDIAAGKKKFFHDLPKTTFIGIILSVVFISAMHLLYLKELLYIATYVIAYILATLYSAPPIRFKNRGFSGIIVDGLIEKALPVLAVFAFFNHFGIDTLIFLATSLFVQVSEIITHQIHDYEHDLKTGINTFVVNIGIDNTSKVFTNFIRPSSIALMLLLCSLILVKIPYASIIAITVFVAFAVMFFLISKGKLNREEQVFPLSMACPHFLISNAFTPFLAFILSLRFPLYTILLLITVIFQYYTIKNFFNVIRRKVILREGPSDT